MALHSLYCADVPLRNCSLTHSLTHSLMERNWISAFSESLCLTENNDALMSRSHRHIRQLHDPYFAECPGLTALMSPATTTSPVRVVICWISSSWWVTKMKALSAAEVNHSVYSNG